MLAAEDALRPLSVEVAVWFDRQGTELGRRVGQPSEVILTTAEAASMTDAILTHNHPDGWTYPPTDARRAGASFSDDDFVLAVATDLAEPRVVTPRLRFAVTRPDAGWGVTAEAMRREHATYTLVVAVELKVALDAGTISLEEIGSGFYHEVARRLARRFGITYRRWAG